MPFKPLVTAGIESLLNTFLYRSPALKTARSRLLGKVLRISWVRVWRSCASLPKLS